MCIVRSLKSETHRTRFTLGGDRLECNEEPTAVPATLTTVKLYLSVTISTPGSRCTTLCKNNYYQGTLVECKDYEHTQITISMVP